MAASGAVSLGLRWHSEEAIEKLEKLNDALKTKINFDMFPKELREYAFVILWNMEHAILNIDKFKNATPGVTKLLRKALIDDVTQKMVKVFATVLSDSTYQIYIEIEDVVEKNSLYIFNPQESSLFIETVSEELYFGQLMTRLAFHEKNTAHDAFKTYLVEDQTRPKLNPNCFVFLKAPFQKYTLHRTLKGEYQVYFKMSEELHYQRLDSENKDTYYFDEGYFLRENVIKFYRDLCNVLSVIREKNYSILEPRITKATLQRILEYILDTQEVKQALSSGKSFRFSKEVTGLPLSFHLTPFKDTYRLIINTKSKTTNQDVLYRKNPLRTIENTKFVTVKTAIGIHDGIEILVEKKPKELKPKDSTIEAHLSQHTSSEFCHPQFVGQTYYGDSEISRPQFSNAANTDLFKLLHGSRNTSYKNHLGVKAFKLSLFPETQLSEHNKDIIALEIMMGLKAIHGSNQIHQDIKLQNILVWLESDGYWHARIADFVNAEVLGKFGNAPPLATLGYESPQISQLNAKFDSEFHRDFHADTDFFSYGRYIAQRNKGKLGTISSAPDAKNDMWALGILLCFLYFGPNFKFKREAAKINAHPLISRLLKINPEERFTAEQAIVAQKAWMESKKPTVELLTPMFSRLSLEGASASSVGSADIDMTFLIAHVSGRFQLLAPFEKEKYISSLCSLYKVNPTLLEHILYTHLQPTLKSIKEAVKDNKIVCKLIETVCENKLKNMSVTSSECIISLSLADAAITDAHYDQLMIYYQNLSPKKVLAF